MTEPTMAELLRLDTVLTKEMPEIRFRRIYAAHATKFGWPFCGDDGEYVEDSEGAWQAWAKREEEYNL